MRYASGKLPARPNARIASGEVAERLNAPVLKTGVGAIRPWVRIPPSPPIKIGKFVKARMAFEAPKISQVALQVALNPEGE
jgi:hypothetical protein